MPPFDPDWTVRPGATLKEWREEMGLSARVTATLCRLDRETYERLEAGELALTPDIARKLQQATSIPAGFWIRFEQRYREDLAAGRKDVD